VFYQKSLSKIFLLYFVAILFAIFNISDIRISGLSKLTPLFDLMMIFYFGVFKFVFQVWFIFLLGLFNDALNGNPLGLTSLIYILIVKFFIILNAKMMIRENFPQICQQFIIFCGSFLVLKWALLSIFNQTYYGLSTLVVQFILTCCLYIVMHKFFEYLEEKLLSGK